MQTIDNMSQYILIDSSSLLPIFVFISLALCAIQIGFIWLSVRHLKLRRVLPSKLIKSGKWTCTLGKDCIVRSRTDAPTFRDDLVIVLVHGILDNHECWDNVIDQYLEDIECNVVSFTWNAHFFMKASLAEATTALDRALSVHLHSHTELSKAVDNNEATETGSSGTSVPKSDNGFDHYLFISHSAGGLVLKELLSRWKQHTHGMRSGKGPEWKHFNRIAGMFLLAVPHRGGRWPTWLIAFTTYNIVYLATLPARIVTLLATQGKLGLGYCSVPWSLRPFFSSLSKLEKEFTDSIKMLESLPLKNSSKNSIVDETFVRNLPRYDFAGTGDTAATSIKYAQLLPNEDHKGVIKEVVEDVKIFLKNHNIQTLFVTTSTRDLSLELDEQQDCLRRPLFIPQQEIFDEATRLLRLANRASSTQQPICLHGPAGIGKSVLMRRLARACCRSNNDTNVAPQEDHQNATSYESNKTEILPYAIYVPLHLFKLDKAESKKFVKDTKSAWDVFIAKWVSWINELPRRCSRTRSIGMDANWWHDMIRHHKEKVVILLESVDEFIADNPNVTIEYMCKIINSYPTIPGPCAVVWACRNSLLGFKKLTNGSNVLPSLRRPTLQELCKQFDISSAAFDSVLWRRLEHILTIPMVFNALRERFKDNEDTNATNYLEAGRFATEAVLFSEALDCIIDRRRKIKEIEDSVESLTNTLSILAWSFYMSESRSVFRITPSDAAQAVKAKVSEWEQQRTLLLEKGDDLNELIEQFKKCTNKHYCKQLMENTVLVPVDRSAFRFTHIEFLDVLVGRYLALCMRHSMFSELGLVAYKQIVMRRGAHIWGETTITPKFIDRILEETQRSGPLVFANAVAFISVNTSNSIEVAALNRIFEGIKCGEQGRVSGALRLVSLIAASWRILSVEPENSQLRVSLCNYLRTSTISTDPVLRSFCKQLLIVRCRVDETENEPENYEADLLMSISLQGICNENDNDPGTERERSLQRCFLQLLQLFEEEPTGRAVFTVHYLWYLAVVSLKHMAIVSVSRYIDEILGGGERSSEFRKKIAVDSNDHDGTLELFDAIVALWAA